MLSPGAEPVRLPVPGADDPRVLTLRNLDDMDAILREADSATVEHALVIGAGYIGLEMAEAFEGRGLKVTLVERLPHVLSVADPEMVFLQEDDADCGLVTGKCPACCLPVVLADLDRLSLIAAGRTRRLADAIKELDPEMKLSSIDSRGSLVWPGNHALAEDGDHWRCQYGRRQWRYDRL